VPLNSWRNAFSSRRSELCWVEELVFTKQLYQVADRMDRTEWIGMGATPLRNPVGGEPSIACQETGTPCRGGRPHVLPARKKSSLQPRTKVPEFSFLCPELQRVLIINVSGAEFLLCLRMNNTA
jgi:hypothetical protein